ncbi:nitrate reductase NapAB chaperone NapD [Symbiobacterium terraclitae]|uniref:Nitrate reductase NapAB chaperone NapD n=1 Tax=Symbiobacterium terraclitae TaxID=557451 RepID=A0ABS4JWD1_9FIRM|nr:chaperone NapD [Symbiobacterium terraclitae]MBP2018739.1 nitrate reductase NapAB chaperone NapD [Symbiobacterium terraclitae]
MVISGLVLQCHPDRVESVAAQLAQMPGVSDVTPVEGGGHLACVLEAPSLEASILVLDHLKALPGVYSAMPTYIHALEEDERWNSPAVHS